MRIKYLAMDHFVKSSILLSLVPNLESVCTKKLNIARLSALETNKSYNYKVFLSQLK